MVRLMLALLRICRTVPRSRGSVGGLVGALMCAALLLAPWTGCKSWEPRGKAAAGGGKPAAAKSMADTIPDASEVGLQRPDNPS